MQINSTVSKIYRSKDTAVMVNIDRTTIQRLGFGFGKRDDSQQSWRRWFDGQLENYRPIVEQSPFPERMQIFLDARQTFKNNSQISRDKKNDFERERRRKVHQQFYADALLRTEHAVHSDTPFVERIVHFWANHFAISADKLIGEALAGPFEFDAIRPHVLGNFSKLLEAAVLHPAMLIYLDQASAVGPNSMVAMRREISGRRQLGLNENLAREILELHTVGLEAGYTLSDIENFARALTGFTVKSIGNLSAARKIDGAPGGMLFLDEIHEQGQVNVMGKRYAQSGKSQTLAILSDLATHASTARTIATKLARHFIADKPNEQSIDRISKAFVNSNGQLSEVYLAVAKEVSKPEMRKPKFKSPNDWVISSLYSIDAPLPPARRLYKWLKGMGQPVWAPGSPKGFADTKAVWLSPSGLLARAEIASTIPGTLDQLSSPEELFAKLAESARKDQSFSIVSQAGDLEQALSLFLLTPEFLYR
jgi:uncharacterized protein (DUF1800 family)